MNERNWMKKISCHMLARWGVCGAYFIAVSFIWFFCARCFNERRGGWNDALIQKTVPIRTGKIGWHFPVREKSILKRLDKILKKSGNFRQKLFIIFQWYLNEVGIIC